MMPLDTSDCSCEVFPWVHDFSLITCSYEPYCGSCGKQCNKIERDYGVGITDYHGIAANDVDVRRVSDCCEGEIVG